MSSQSPVIWWYREGNCEVVGMSVEAAPELGAESVEQRNIFRNVSSAVTGSTQPLEHN
jgi:hypothetical protein